MVNLSLTSTIEPRYWIRLSHAQWTAEPMVRRIYCTVLYLTDHIVYLFTSRLVLRMTILSQYRC